MDDVANEIQPPKRLTLPSHFDALSDDLLERLLSNCDAKSLGQIAGTATRYQSTANAVLSNVDCLRKLIPSLTVGISGVSCYDLQLHSRRASPPPRRNLHDDLNKTVHMLEQVRKCTVHKYPQQIAVPVINPKLRMFRCFPDEFGDPYATAEFCTALCVGIEQPLELLVSISTDSFVNLSCCSEEPASGGAWGTNRQLTVWSRAGTSAQRLAQVDFDDRAPYIESFYTSTHNGTIFVDTEAMADVKTILSVPAVDDMALLQLWIALACR
jgi:hypothetical protein